MKSNVPGRGKGAGGAYVAGGGDVRDAGLRGSCDIVGGNGQSNVDRPVHGYLDVGRLAGGVEHILPCDSIVGLPGCEVVALAGQPDPMGQFNMVRRCV